MNREFPVVYTVRLSEAQVAELKQAAASEKRSAGAVLRELIDGYVEAKTLVSS